MTSRCFLSSLLIFLLFQILSFAFNPLQSNHPQILQDVIEKLALKQKWELEGLYFSKLEVSKATRLGLGLAKDTSFGSGLESLIYSSNSPTKYLPGTNSAKEMAAISLILSSKLIPLLYSIPLKWKVPSNYASLPITKLPSSCRVRIAAKTMYLRQMIRSQTDVAMNLANKILLSKIEDSNLVFSPLSIQVVLSAIAAGSNGSTLDQLLGFLKSKSNDHFKSFSKIIPAVFADGSPVGGPRLPFAYSVWSTSLSLSSTLLIR